MTNKKNKLRELRSNKSLTTAALEVGISRQMLSYLEAGERTPSLPLAQRLADYYGVTVDYIFFKDDGNDTLQRATGTES